MTSGFSGGAASEGERALPPVTPDVDMLALRAPLAARLAKSDPAGAADFLRRFDRYAPDVLTLLAPLYGERADFAAMLGRIFETALDAYLARPADLRALDRTREAAPTWYQDNAMMGGVCYVDRFAGTLRGVQEKIDYFKELGLNYLHLMPLFRTPDGPSDGGYAVSSYREVNPVLGTMDDLRALAAALRGAGISPVLDFVFNHTARDHDWALKARAGDPEFRAYYFFYEDRAMPDAYERTLREIFPDEHPGAFTYDEELGHWVWATFHTYQWDLNYRNPAVFRQMLEELLFLANVGVEVLRLDAVAFVWKELGTNCENLPQAHAIIRAFNALVRIAAPGMVFKSEAIVHPDDVLRYFGTGAWEGRECEISYNPLLMVELWEALATGYTALLRLSMQKRFAIPANCAWINYVRSHDDIGWGFADEDCAELGIHGFYHRQYLNRFYTGQEPDSFATGYPFQFNPKNQDMRISGSTASLCGLEQALNENDAEKIELALRRILLIYGVAISMGGIPLIYLGDEIGQINDYTYQDDPARADDSRWVHRGPMDWDRALHRSDPGTVEGRLFQGFTRMIGVRKLQPAFGASASTQVLALNNGHLYAYIKAQGASRVLAVCNFSAQTQQVPAAELPGLDPGAAYTELVSGRALPGGDDLVLGPYEFAWIALAGTLT